jgi:hypothetical protein
MTALVVGLGIAVLFQFVILRIKWNKGLYTDAGVDLLMLIVLNSVFGGSILGVISATAGSVLISLYLMVYPIRLLSKETELEMKEFFSLQDDLDTSMEDLASSINKDN